MQKAATIARFGDIGSEKQRATILTVVAALATLFCIVVPRISPLVVVAFAVAASTFLLFRDVQTGQTATEAKSVLLRPEMPFVAWILIACLWSARPDIAVVESLFLAVLILSAVILANRFPEIEARDREAIARGLLVGFILGGLYVCMEITMRDAMGRFILTHFPALERGLEKHGKILEGVVTRLSGAHMTRAAIVYCLLWCPALLAATLYTKGRVKWLSYACIAATSLLLVFHPLTQSQTAQLVMFAVTFSLALAILLPKVALWLMAAIFAAWLFLVVPASMAMFNAGLHLKEDLFKSARARVIIWNYTAEQILERPIVGVGASSTRYIDEARPREEKRRPKGFVAAPATRAHPHNIYLQIWYELGVVGILAFAFLGFSLLWKSQQLPRMAVPFAVAHFSICITVLAPTYGLWQNWFQSIVVLSILALMLVAGYTTSTDPKETDPVPIV